MSTGPVVSVRGSGVIEAAPEVAVLIVTLTVGVHVRDQAQAQLVSRSTELATALSPHAGALESTVSSPLRVYPVFDDTRRVRHYRGTQTTTLTVADFNALSDVVLAAWTIENAVVHGPSWQLRPSSDAYRRARVAAVEDAVNKARSYADALGVKLSGMVDLADAEDPTASAVVSRLTPAELRDLGEHPASMDFDPIPQVVTQVVEARFALEAPDLDAFSG